MIRSNLSACRSLPIASSSRGISDGTTSFRFLSTTSTTRARVSRPVKRVKSPGNEAVGPADAGDVLEVRDEDLAPIEYLRRSMRRKPAVTLPALDCPELEKELFGAVPATRSGYNWDRLEWLGDRELNCIAARICFLMAPAVDPAGTRVGPWLSTSFTNLTSNALAGEFASRYRLSALLGSSLPGKDAADRFEAFVGALSISKGPKAVSDFLAPLFYQKVMLQQISFDALPPLSPTFSHLYVPAVSTASPNIRPAPIVVVPFPSISTPVPAAVPAAAPPLSSTSSQSSPTPPSTPTLSESTDPIPQPVPSTTGPLSPQQPSSPPAPTTTLPPPSSLTTPIPVTPSLDKKILTLPFYFPSNAAAAKDFMGVLSQAGLGDYYTVDEKNKEIRWKSPGQACIKLPYSKKKSKESRLAKLIKNLIQNKKVIIIDRKLSAAKALASSDVPPHTIFSVSMAPAPSADAVTVIPPTSSPILPDTSTLSPPSPVVSALPSIPVVVPSSSTILPPSSPTSQPTVESFPLLFSTRIEAFEQFESLVKESGLGSFIDETENSMTFYLPGKTARSARIRKCGFRFDSPELRSQRLKSFIFSTAEQMGFIIYENPSTTAMIPAVNPANPTSAVVTAVISDNSSIISTPSRIAGSSAFISALRPLLVFSTMQEAYDGMVDRLSTTQVSKLVDTDIATIDLSPESRIHYEAITSFVSSFSDESKRPVPNDVTKQAIASFVRGCVFRKIVTIRPNVDRSTLSKKLQTFLTFSSEGAAAAMIANSIGTTVHGAHFSLVSPLAGGAEDKISILECGKYAVVGCGVGLQNAVDDLVSNAIECGLIIIKENEDVRPHELATEIESISQPFDSTTPSIIDIGTDADVATLAALSNNSASASATSVDDIPSVDNHAAFYAESAAIYHAEIAKSDDNAGEGQEAVINTQESLESGGTSSGSIQLDASTIVGEVNAKEATVAPLDDPISIFLPSLSPIQLEVLPPSQRFFTELASEQMEVPSSPESSSTSKPKSPSVASIILSMYGRLRGKA